MHISNRSNGNIISEARISLSTSTITYFFLQNIKRPGPGGMIKDILSLNYFMEYIVRTRACYVHTHSGASLVDGTIHALRPIYLNNGILAGSLSYEEEENRQL